MGEAEVDVVIVGAGMAGLYALHRLRNDGFGTVVVEAADDVGGTWYWNRYPGARCDIESIDYSFSFDPELEQEWVWSERYATQPEILRYLQHVADRHDLRRDIRFSTRVTEARWDEAAKRWRVGTSPGGDISARFLVMATGCLSMPKVPDVCGADRFRGEVYFTSSWPHEGVDFTGKKVGVIGTGSSAIQSIPLIARQAAELVVFQRTPAYSIPARNGPIRPEKRAAYAGRERDYREEARWTGAGVPIDVPKVGALQVSDAERQAHYEAMWEAGELLRIGGAFADTLLNRASNETLCEFVRGKIRDAVDDPETAEALCPTDFPIGTKRPCLDTDYYATYNLPHVRLVDLRRRPIVGVTETGIDIADEQLGFDAIVYATGFDAMTGAIGAVDITGCEAARLKEKWAQGPETYLGLMTHGFPNLFMVTGPGSPSVLSNMAVSIEQHVEWIADTLVDMRGQGFETIEPTEMAEAGWKQHGADLAGMSLVLEASSWYVGANVPGKPRVVLPYLGGVGPYRKICNEVRARGYLGLALAGPGRAQCNDGVVRRLMPDVDFMLRMVESYKLPGLETMSPAEARSFMATLDTQRPPGPDVGEVVDGSFPGARGALAYRLYRPATPGPHAITLYFHGGGWVIGSQLSDDPLCRDLCTRSETIIVSVDYRHGPEDPFPAAHDDAYAALQWLSRNAEELGGRKGGVIIAGWSAGGNLAASVCQQARDRDGPEIAGQVLLTPVAACDPSTGSYVDNAEGYMLTAAVMRFFLDNAVAPEHRHDPRIAIGNGNLSDLPPAMVITAEFDPLRDEGNAYAAALAAAGNKVSHVQARGHVHSSITMVGTIASGAPYRAMMGDAIRRFAATTA